MFASRLRHLALIASLGMLGACASAPERPIDLAAPTPATTNAPAATTPPATHALPGDIHAPRTRTGSTGSNLKARIDAFIAQPRFDHASWGINVVEANTGRVRYAHNARKLAVPASNAKLFTGAVALATLGSNARFMTRLYATAEPRGNGILAGDLIVEGGGDPSLGDVSVAPASSGWADQFAAALLSRGIVRIRGDLIGDDTWYQGPGIGSGWEAGDLQSWYAPRVSALSVQSNVMVMQVTRNGTGCCDVTLTPSAAAQVFNLTHAATPNGDAISIYRPPGSNEVYVSGTLPSGTHSQRFVLAAPDPAMLAAQLLHEAMTRRGITLDGRIRAVHWPQVNTALDRRKLTLIAQIASPPLRDLVTHTLKKSDNLYAQSLLLQVGVATARTGICADRARPPQRSEQWGLCAMRAMLLGAGIDSATATFVEGTGLSRKDLVTPAATTSLLRWIGRQPFAANLRAALPVAGVDGSLAHRLRKTLAQNNLRAKTGTLTHAYALSGYVNDADGQPLIFSLILDRYQRPRDVMGRSIAPSPTADLDAVAAMLANDSSVAVAPPANTP